MIDIRIYCNSAPCERKKIRIGERQKKRRKKKLLNNYYGGMMNEIAMDLVRIKEEQMEFTNQMIKKAVFEELFE